MCSFLLPGETRNPRLVTVSQTVRDDPKLSDDGEEIPKFQGGGWRFNSRLWNLLSAWRNTCKLVNCFLCFDIGLLAFCLFFYKKNCVAKISKNISTSSLVAGKLSAAKLQSSLLVGWLLPTFLLQKCWIKSGIGSFRWQIAKLRRL